MKRSLARTWAFSTLFSTLLVILLAQSHYVLAETPSNIETLEPIKKGSYIFYTPYLEEEIDSLALVPPPPAKGTAAFEKDKAAALKEYPPARMAQATQDARITPDYFAGIYSLAIGKEISRKATPAVYTLLARSIADYGLSTYAAKNHYNRTRPFIEFGLYTCSPYAEDHLSKDGSYPSGHTASGYGISLVLAQVAPQYKEAFIARGKDYAHSRVVCNVHYPSDLKAGMQVADAVLQKQLDNKQFQTDLKAAQDEWKALVE